MDAHQFIRTETDFVPKVAIILGSGLGGIADRIDRVLTIPFADIPGFAASTAGGHRGELILGNLQGERVVAMAGRLHRYEGHSRAQVALPVATMSALGATTLIVSNAAGGLNPDFSVGDLVVIRDHIDWLGGGPDGHVTSPAPVGVFRQDEVYCPVLGDAAVRSGLRHGFVVHHGTYLATLGPNYETRAEYRMMRRLGADLAGMSTVPEAITAARHGMKVLAVSMVSNVANPDAPQVADHAEVLAAGQLAGSKLERIVRDVLGNVAATDSPGTRGD